jgi:hypothetical protein
MTRLAVPEGVSPRGRASLLRAGFGCAALLIASGALAQRFEVKRPTTLIVGPPRGPCPEDRVDAMRSGRARTALPTGTLRIDWHHAVGQEVDHAPLVTEDGDVVVLGARGDAVTLDKEGGERHRVSVGIGTTGPGAVLSDGTVALINGAGEVVGIRGGAVRFRTRVGERGATVRAAPLALEDGGVVVGDGTDLIALDGAGNVRARTTLPEQVAAPLLAAQGKVVAVGLSGAVFLWPPGRDAARAGSFGSPVDGGAALADARTLVGVVESSHLAALDLEQGVVVTRTVAAGGFLLGPPSLRGQTAYMLADTPGALLAVGVDASGHEVLRAVVNTTPASALGDGGPPSPPLGSHATLTDAAGTLAFATPDGTVGVVTAWGAVETLGDPLCLRGATSRGPVVIAGVVPSFRVPQAVTGLVPAGPGAFLVACQSGLLSRVSAP